MLGILSTNISALIPHPYNILRIMAQFSGWLANQDQICALKSFETLRKLENTHREGKVPANTQAPLMQFQITQSRSNKKISHHKYEISFQNGILDNHVMAFGVFFQKYWQIGSKNVSTSRLTNVQKITLDSKNFDYVAWMLAQLECVPNITLAEKLQLVEDWKMQQNLCKFVKLITDLVQPALKTEIIYLTNLVWEQYLKVPNFKWKEEEKVKKISESLTEKIENIYCMSELKFLTFDPAFEEAKEAFADFLVCYAETVYLVIQGYFENPISSADNRQSRRLSSVDWEELYEEQFQRIELPKKMPKLS